MTSCNAVMFELTNQKHCRDLLLGIYVVMVVESNQLHKSASLTIIQFFCGCLAVRKGLLGWQHMDLKHFSIPIEIMWWVRRHDAMKVCLEAPTE